MIGSDKPLLFTGACRQDDTLNLKGDETVDQKILFVVDKPLNKKLLQNVFSKHGYLFPLQFTPSVDEGLNILRREAVKAVFVGEQVSGRDYFTFIGMIKDLNITVPVILVMEEKSEILVSDAIKRGALDCVMRNTRSLYAYPFVLDRAIARYELELERSERERIISESQKLWVAVIDGIKDFIFIIDKESRVFRANQALSDAFGKHPKDVIGRDLGELFGGETMAMLHAISEDGLPKTEEKNVRDETYLISSFPFHYDGQSLTIFVMKNISEMRRLKEQLYHSYKLASLGLLISGIAHEINNPVAGVITYTELLKMKVKDEQIRDGLQKILNGAERCKRVIENLLTFSRQKAPSKNLESLNDVIDRTIELRIYWLKKYNIEVVRNYGEIPFILMDSQQMQMVILNVLLNAEQALVDADIERGKVTFITSYDEARQKIVVTISDNGPGIPQEVISKIFDPFFTTKPVGTGTGLGLSIAHGIVSEHEGSIRVDSQKGEGTTFTIEIAYTKKGKPDSILKKE